MSANHERASHALIAAYEYCRQKHGEPVSAEVRKPSLAITWILPGDKRSDPATFADFSPTEIEGAFDNLKGYVGSKNYAPITVAYAGNDPPDDGT